MKILIVDDHAMIRSGLRQLCAERGASVFEADSGKTALALAQSERPQLIVLDLNLPGVSGLELLRQLLEIDSGARILVFSMHGEPVYAARALKIGARGYVSKNASPEELRTAFGRVAAGLTYVENEIAQQLAALPGDQRSSSANAIWKSCACSAKAAASPKSPRPWASATRRWPIPPPRSNPNSASRAPPISYACRWKWRSRAQVRESRRVNAAFPVNGCGTISDDLMTVPC